MNIKAKNIIRNKWSYFIMIKGYQKEITVINVYAPNNRDPKVHEIKTDILKGEIDNSATIFGDFNTTFSIIKLLNIKSVIIWKILTARATI